MYVYRSIKFCLIKFSVKSWGGRDKSYLYNIKNQLDGENGQDEWDKEYDKGKVKKKRKLDDDDNDFRKSKSNSFQDFQNYKNRSKVNLGCNKVGLYTCVHAYMYECIHACAHACRHNTPTL